MPSKGALTVVKFNSASASFALALALVQFGLEAVPPHSERPLCLLVDNLLVLSNSSCASLASANSASRLAW